ncbi:unnamed protein product [Sphacelaria rigidula]
MVDMTRVLVLNLVSRVENNADDDDEAGGGGGSEEFEIEIPSRFSPARLAQALQPHCSIGKKGIFSRGGLWRGPLSALPQSFPLHMPPSLSVLELILLPEEDDGSLALPLARAQLSVPLLPQRAKKQQQARASGAPKPSYPAGAGLGSTAICGCGGDYATRNKNSLCCFYFWFSCTRNLAHDRITEGHEHGGLNSGGGIRGLWRPWRC